MEHSKPQSFSTVYYLKDRKKDKPDFKVETIKTPSQKMDKSAKQHVVPITNTIYLMDSYIGNMNGCINNLVSCLSSMDSCISKIDDCISTIENPSENLDDDQNKLDEDCNVIQIEELGNDPGGMMDNTSSPFNYGVNFETGVTSITQNARVAEIEISEDKVEIHSRPKVNIRRGPSSGNKAYILTNKIHPKNQFKAIPINLLTTQYNPSNNDEAKISSRPLEEKLKNMNLENPQEIPGYPAFREYTTDHPEIKEPKSVKKHSSRVRDKSKRIDDHEIGNVSDRDENNNFQLKSPERNADNPSNVADYGQSEKISTPRPDIITEAKNDLINFNSLQHENKSQDLSDQGMNRVSSYPENYQKRQNENFKFSDAVNKLMKDGKSTDYSTYNDNRPSKAGSSSANNDDRILIDTEDKNMKDAFETDMCAEILQAIRPACLALLSQNNCYPDEAVPYKNKFVSKKKNKNKKSNSFFDDKAKSENMNPSFLSQGNEYQTTDKPISQFEKIYQRLVDTDQQTSAINDSIKQKSSDLTNADNLRAYQNRVEAYVQNLNSKFKPWDKNYASATYPAPQSDEALNIQRHRSLPHSKYDRHSSNLVEFEESYASDADNEAAHEIKIPSSRNFFVLGLKSPEKADFFSILSKASIDKKRLNCSSVRSNPSYLPLDENLINRNLNSNLERMSIPRTYPSNIAKDSKLSSYVPQLKEDVTNGNVEIPKVKKKRRKRSKNCECRLYDTLNSDPGSETEIRITYRSSENSERCSQCSQCSGYHNETTLQDFRDSLIESTSPSKEHSPDYSSLSTVSYSHLDINNSDTSKDNSKPTDEEMTKSFEFASTLALKGSLGEAIVYEDLDNPVAKDDDSEIMLTEDIADRNNMTDNFQRPKNNPKIIYRKKKKSKCKDEKKYFDEYSNTKDKDENEEATKSATGNQEYDYQPEEKTSLSKTNETDLDGEKLKTPDNIDAIQPEAVSKEQMQMENNENEKNNTFTLSIGNQVNCFKSSIFKPFKTCISIIYKGNRENVEDWSSIAQCGSCTSTSGKNVVLESSIFYKGNHSKSSLKTPNSEPERLLDEPMIVDSLVLSKNKFLSKDNIQKKSSSTNRSEEFVKFCNKNCIGSNSSNFSGFTDSEISTIDVDVRKTSKYVFKNTVKTKKTEKCETTVSKTLYKE